MGCSSSKSSPQSSSVLVLGATGHIGKATVLTLKKHHVNVTAGVRDPNSKEAQEFVNSGIKVIQVDMGSAEDALAEKIKGFESVLINTPGHIDRTKIAINAAKAVKKAGAKYVLTVSVAVAETQVLFGKQFREIEEEIKKLDIPYGFLRLPMFIDNNYMQAASIIKDGVFYGPIQGDLQFCQVAVQDAANAASQILSHYTDYKNQIFHLTSDKKSFNEIAKEFSSVLGKEVKYVCGGYEESKKAFIHLGIPEWQADGILELFKLVEAKDPTQTILTNSFKEVTGSHPTTFLEWAKQNAVGFGGVQSPSATENKASTEIKEHKQNESNQKGDIIVLGASGNIGVAAVHALLAKKANVAAGVRDPSKANVKELETAGAKIVKADMSHTEAELAAVLANYKAVFIVTPGHIERAKLTINAIKAAKDAKVEYILVVSLPCAGNNDILFGRQFAEIEKEVLASGLNYGLLKLPMFIDNTYGNAQAISGSNTFYGPIDGTHKFASVSCEDAGVAAAEILLHHANHHKKSYTIISDHQNYDEMAHSFSTALGREIKYANAHYEGTKQALLAFMPEWQVDGVLELYKLIEKSDNSMNLNSHDFKTLTGKEPTSNEQWMKKHAAAFAHKSG